MAQANIVARTINEAIPGDVFAITPSVMQPYDIPWNYIVIIRVEGDDVISEASRHIRNIATLGKLASLRPSLASGTDAQEDEETAPQTGGSAVNASTAEDPHQSPEN